MRTLFLLLAAQLAACSAEERRAPDPLVQKSRDTADVQARTSPPPPPPPAAALPGLLPLGEREILAALGSGASCSLSDGGPPLMVAMPGKAVAKDRGGIVTLASPASDWRALIEGGRFSGEDLTIEVDPGAIVSEEGGIARDASVSVIRMGRGFSVSHGPRWTCGS